METGAKLTERLWAARYVIAAAALALAGVVASNASLWAGALGVVLVGVAAALPVVTARTAADAPLRGPPGGGRGGIEPLFAAIPMPLIVLEPDLSIRLFNQPALALLPNLRAGEPISFALRVPDVMEALRSVVEKGGTRRVDYTERVPLDRAVEAQAAAVAGPDGRTQAVILVLRDFTQQQRLEQMRADFVANASHELRTPLASLLGFVETLQGPARNDAAAREKFLGIMRAQANRMSRLIDDLLSLSRIELNAHVRPERPVDLSGIVAHVADTLSPLAKERSVTLSIDRPAGAVEVLGERDELIRVFENLVENAIKYGASGGKVEIALVEERRGPGRAAEAVATVRDYGPGIAAEHLPRLTERFYRVDVAQSRDKGGTGLGLAIVKHILARHRGRLSIASEIGQGATFTVRIELSPQD